MANNRPLSSEERLEIVEVLKKGNLSHREIAKRFNRAQSTVSSIGRDAGITPTHRRRRTPAASHDLESTYDKQERINFEDRFIGVLDGMLTDGGLSPREAREVAQAAKVVLDARRSEDVEHSDSSLGYPEASSRFPRNLTPQELEKQGWVDVGLGDIRIHPDTEIGRELFDPEEVEAAKQENRYPMPKSAKPSSPESDVDEAYGGVGHA
jgi:transposase-like protein